jgi:hypothetical protein
MTETTARTGATTETVEGYLRFWNTPPGDPQRTVGADVFTTDVAYVTPIGVRSGVEELVDFTEQFVAGVGAYELVSRSAPDVHHDRVRVPWEIRVGATSFAEGTDVLVTDETGRIVEVTAFIDRAPEGFDEHHGGAA